MQDNFSEFSWINCSCKIINIVSYLFWGVCSVLPVWNWIKHVPKFMQMACFKVIQCRQTIGTSKDYQMHVHIDFSSLFWWFLLILVSRLWPNRQQGSYLFMLVQPVFCVSQLCVANFLFCVVLFKMRWDSCVHLVFLFDVILIMQLEWKLEQDDFSSIHMMHCFTN